MAPKWIAVAFTALLLSALGQTQTFTTVFDFTTGGYPFAALIQDGADNLYSTGATLDDSNDGGVFKIDTAGAMTVLHIFTGSPDGFSPMTPLVQDTLGNFYGTTMSGGVDNQGAVFEIDTAGNETILYSFAGGTTDGCNPYQGLVMDASGNLYGTMVNCGTAGYGTVFKLSSAGTETVLHNFTGGASDGAYPHYGHLLLDESSNLFGLTMEGGISESGVLYEVTAAGAFEVLHRFAGGTKDGCYPIGTLATDKLGSFYGTTTSCGRYGWGTVWKVSKKGMKTILHNFAGAPADGAIPYAGVVLDSKGYMYGTTSGGGKHDDGTLYRLSNNGTLTLLHSFHGSDGWNPIGEVLRNKNQDLYGTTVQGGSHDDGTVWQYVPRNR